ncbi:hypothetical protein EYZ11_007023 [Aspergillus tanneri]|uniref:Uncharacterized protein n=1 Tax=Aspergillus tanneri TaxID=1220188 RepID=A0A4S3JE00_9EURO|nr:hypothetical protein EYZ11_007023 [Aspergillus tanneri]
MLEALDGLEAAKGTKSMPQRGCCWGLLLGMERLKASVYKDDFPSLRKCLSLHWTVPIRVKG